MDKEHIEFVDYYIRMCWHKLSRMYNNKAVDYNLTNSTGYILMIIEKEGTPSTQLGPKMGMEPTSLSRTLKSMEDDGLIYRKPSKNDSRKVFIHLTPKGVELRKISINTLLEFNEKLRTKVNPTKLKTFYEVMNIIDELADVELENQRKATTK